jgi:hypothetical protein
LLEDHKDEIKDFLERGEYAFFPEVVLSMNVGLFDEDESFESLIVAADSVNKGFNLNVGKVKVNFRPDGNKLIDDRRQMIFRFRFVLSYSLMKKQKTIQELYFTI